MSYNRASSRQNNSCYKHIGFSNNSNVRTVFTLSKLAYYACPEDYKKFYNKIPNAPKFDIQKCCEGILKALRLNTVLGCNKYLNSHYKECKNDYDGYTVACKEAAKYGHLDCLMFAHENGFFWDVATIDNAKKYRHFECYTYAKENECPLIDGSLDFLTLLDVFDKHTTSFLRCVLKR